MGKLPAQTQMYIMIALIAVGALAVAFFGIVPLFQSAADVDAQFANEQTNLATAQALLARRQSAKAQSAGNEVELMRIANELPDSPQLPSVIVELQDVANAAGIELRSITPGDLVDGDPLTAGSTVSTYQVVPVVLLVEGDWVEAIDYLQRVRDLDRGVRVVTANFRYVPDETGDAGHIEADFALEVYVMPTTTAAVTAPEPAVTTP